MFFEVEEEYSIGRATIIRLKSSGFVVGLGFLLKKKKKTKLSVLINEEQNELKEMPACIKKQTWNFYDVFVFLFLFYICPFLFAFDFL